MSGLENDIVFIQNLEIQTIIGIHPRERTTPQTVLISLELQTETAAAAAGDDIGDAVDYETLTRRVTDFVSHAEFQLIETLAENIAALVLENIAVKLITVEVQKPNAIDNAGTVGVRIHRTHAK